MVRPTARHLPRQGSQARSGRRASVVLLGLASIALVVGSCLVSGSPRTTVAAPAENRALPNWPDFSVRRESTPPRWEAVLTELGRRRSHAWSRGSPPALREVFVPGSVLLRGDRAALRAYLERGLEVDRAMSIFASVRLVDRSTSEVVLTTVDHLSQITVHSAEGEHRLLPRDRPTRHQIELRHTASGWRIAAIRDLTG